MNASNAHVCHVRTCVHLGAARLASVVEPPCALVSLEPHNASETTVGALTIHNHAEDLNREGDRECRRPDLKQVAHSVTSNNYSYRPQQLLTNDSLAGCRLQAVNFLDDVDGQA